jgi:hypothetical protein
VELSTQHFAPLSQSGIAKYHIKGLWQRGVGVDSAWEQYKLEARKLFVNRADSRRPLRIAIVAAIPGPIVEDKDMCRERETAKE